MYSKTCGRGCQQNWDVRCCCELNCYLKNSNKQFYKCPMKLNTTYFHICNNIEYYEYATDNNWKKLKQIFNLNNKELLHIKNLWEEDNKDYDTENNNN